jgi:hypothetical protein
MKHVRSFRLSDELIDLVTIISLVINENPSEFIRRSLIVRIGDVAPIVVKRLQLLDFLLSQNYGSTELYGKLLSLGLTPQSIRKLTKNYLNNKIKKKKLKQLLRAVIEKYRNVAPDDGSAQKLKKAASPSHSKA